MTQLCPYCRTPLEAEDEVVSCPACNTPHHQACVAENGGCTVFGCSQAPVDDVKISVSAQDLSLRPIAPVIAPMVAPIAASTAASVPYSNPHSILGLESPRPEPPLADPAPAQPAPPPRGGTGVPPPPLPPGSVPFPQPGPVPAMFAGYAPPFTPDPYSYAIRKNRVVYVLLAIFLGSFGAHNFYAGFTKRAILQLCISIFTCGVGGLLIWIWAIVEACTVDHDDDGLEFI
jgi:TM2 domain-containing membrane protein YozV